MSHIGFHGASKVGPVGVIIGWGLQVRLYFVSARSTKQWEPVVHTPAARDISAVLWALAD